ncbi:MAG: septum formation family protein [Propionicimonas sp.]|uniref:septum formation family protein n=1 Tax=Propionicimonas sp. TaxID=1955623 RepID=UPI003D12A6F3
MQRRGSRVGVVHALLGALLLAGCTASVDATSPAGSSPSAATPSASAISHLEVGDCTGELDLSGAQISDVPTVACTSGHHWEVHAVVDVAGDTYPGADALTAQADTACAASFEAYVGVEPAYSRFTSAYLTGDENAWAAPENRVITCLAGSEDNELTASAKGDTLVFPVKGQCTGPQDVAAQSVEIIDCAAKHYYEVYAVKQVDSKKAPTAEEEQKLYTSVCLAGFKSFVGLDVGASKYEIAYFLAGEDIWTKVADHRIVCSAGSPTGGVKGSLKGVKK